MATAAAAANATTTSLYLDGISRILAPVAPRLASHSSAAFLAWLRAAQARPRQSLWGDSEPQTTNLAGKSKDKGKGKVNSDDAQEELYSLPGWYALHNPRCASCAMPCLPGLTASHAQLPLPAGESADPKGPKGGTKRKRKRKAVFSDEASGRKSTQRASAQHVCLLCGSASSAPKPNAQSKASFPSTRATAKRAASASAPPQKDPANSKANAEHAGHSGAPKISRLSKPPNSSDHTPASISASKQPSHTSSPLSTNKDKTQNMAASAPASTGSSPSLTNPTARANVSPAAAPKPTARALNGTSVSSTPQSSVGGPKRGDSDVPASRASPLAAKDTPPPPPTARSVPSGSAPRPPSSFSTSSPKRPDTKTDSNTDATTETASKRRKKAHKAGLAALLAKNAQDEAAKAQGKKKDASASGAGGLEAFLDSL